MTMKITKDHYQHIKSAFANVPADQIASMRAAIAADPRVKDAAKRLRWDLMYKTVSSKWVCDHLYKYADDTHIDTALKAAVRELGL